jgi:hypothetical protein
MTRFLRSAFRSRAADGLRYGALAIAGALCLAGCGGGSHSAATKPRAQLATLRDAITAPEATVLKPGETVHVSRAALHTTGWQASCVNGTRRVNAEAVRGQRTGSGRIISYAGGSPSIWAKHNSDGSVTLTCK